MDNTHDGGPAFPAIKSSNAFPSGALDRVYSDGGMSLRDYFAAKAMPEVIAHIMTVRATMIKPGQFNFDEIADVAYQVADAMLRARTAQSPREAQDAHLREFGKS